MPTIPKHNLIGCRREVTRSEAFTAGAATQLFALFTAAEADVEVVAISAVPDADVTGQDTNTAHLNVLNAGTNGNGTTEVANTDLVSGTDLSGLIENWVHADSSAPIQLASKGEALAVQRELVGTGLALPAMKWHVYWKARGSS